MAHSPLRRFLISYFGCLVAAIGVVSAFNAIIDPFQFYRIPTLYKPVYFGGLQRYQNAGLARTQRYDTVVIGSSLTENFLSSYVGKSWGVQSLKLSISGSTAHEQFLVLRQALRTGQVRNVIWGLDAGAFTHLSTWVRDDQAPFPYYLYRWPAVAGIEYFYSLDTTRLSYLVLRGYGETDLDKLDTWYGRFTYGEAATLKAWGGSCAQFGQKYETGQSGLPERDLRLLEQSIQRNLVALVKAHADVNFYLFFPPISTLAYVPAKTVLQLQLPYRRLVVNVLGDLSNVRFFDFQVVSEITENLANYKDAIHFSMPISEYVVDAIRDDRHRVSRSGIDANNRRLIELANGVNLCPGGRNAYLGK